MYNIDDAIDEMNPLDPAGLEFAYPAGSQYSSRTRQFRVLGFRDLEHAQKWKDAYCERAWGYGPIIRIIENNKKIEITVDEMTSCD